MKENLDAVEESLLKGLDLETLPEVFSRIENFKTLADAAGNMKHQVSARSYSILFGLENDRLDHAVADAIWIAGQWDMQRDNTYLCDEMESVNKTVEYFPLFPKISVEQIEMVLGILGEWLQTKQRSPHFLEWAKFKTYQKLGKTDLAEKHKAALLALEAEAPVDLLEMYSCKGCRESMSVCYYSSLGLPHKAIEKASWLLSEDMEKCTMAPRIGLINLIDVLVDAGMASCEEAARAMTILENYLDFPFKATLRVIVPVLRYYLATGQLDDAARMIRRYLPMLDKTCDTWNARRFYLAAATHPEFDGEIFLGKAEVLAHSLQR